LRGRLYSKLQEKPSTYARLRSGWYAYVNLDNADKFAVLARLAFLCDLAYPKDWDFKPDDPTLDLRAKQAVTAQVQALREAGW
jgi:hypothetical protein